MRKNPATRTSLIPDKDITRIVAESFTYREVLDKLGVTQGGGSIRTLRRRIGKLKLSIDHFHGYAGTRKPPEFAPQISTNGRVHIDSITDEAFAEILRQVDTYQNFGKAMGVAKISGSFAESVQKRAARLGLSVEHFAFVKDETGIRRKIETIFIANSSARGYPSARIGSIIIRENLLPNRCNRCHVGPEWQGESLSFTLFHKNTVRDDLRLENLELLCPNCYSQANKTNCKARGLKGALKKIENRKINKYRQLLEV